MTVTRPAERKWRFLYDKIELTILRIIQDCEDALTNWVPQHAAVSSQLSTRARTLSQRRTSRHNQEPVDLTHQDRALDRESWVDSKGEYEQDDDSAYDQNNNHEAEHRGREEERPVAAWSFSLAQLD